MSKETEPQPKNRWELLDRLAADYLLALKEDSDASLRDLAKVLDVSHTRIASYLDQTGTPATLGQFTLLCEYFGKNAAKVLAELEKRQEEKYIDNLAASLQQQNYSFAADIDENKETEREDMESA